MIVFLKIVKYLAFLIFVFQAIWVVCDVIMLTTGDGKYLVSLIIHGIYGSLMYWIYRVCDRKIKWVDATKRNA